MYHISPITYHKSRSSESGQVFVLALIVFALIIVNTLLIVSGSLNIFQNSRYSVVSSQAINLAEAGIDKAVASLNKTGGIYNGESETFIGSGSYTVSVISKDATTNIIRATGYVPNKTNPKSKKTIQIQISKGTGISFVYGMLVGNGGINMGNGSRINGSIYSNGDITGGNNETITGDAWVAGGTQPTADQQSDCVSPNCSDFIFGKNVSSNNQLDIAQSFKPSQTAVINKVSLKLKKTGTPSNITVRLLANSSNNNPDKTNVIASGTLAANLVTSQYGFVDINFTTSPQLNQDTIYWLMLDTSSDNSNYWSWQLDTLQSYTRGAGMWSPDWQAKNPSWNNIAGDLSFKTYMGGVATKISLSNGSVVQGNVHANTINGVTINKDAYYQIISNSVVNGVTYPGTADPAPVAMPISDGNITDWQNQASPPISPSYVGDINGCPASIGPGKYDGNFITGNNCTIIVKSPVWITKNLTIGNAVTFKMDPSYGATSGIIIVDGQVVFSNTDDLIGTGSAGSFLTLLSTYDSGLTGVEAINTGNSSITGILYAPKGMIKLANGANFKEIVAWKIDMGTNTILTYDSGLISTIFSAGPTGSFTPIKGTYQIK